MTRIGKPVAVLSELFYIHLFEFHIVCASAIVSMVVRMRACLYVFASDTSRSIYIYVRRDRIFQLQTHCKNVGKPFLPTNETHSNDTILRLNGLLSLLDTLDVVLVLKYFWHTFPFGLLSIFFFSFCTGWLLLFPCVRPFAFVSFLSSSAQFSRYVFAAVGHDDDW